jgi:hypothetical protein
VKDLVAPLAALIGAFIGAGAATFGKYFVDRRNRLFDEKLKTSVAFLTAADRVTRISSSAMGVTRALDNLDKRETPSERLGELKKRWDSLNDDGVAAWRDAQLALNALRLLLPKVAEKAEKYLNLCNVAGYPDDGKAEREASRIATENLLRKAVNVK